MSGMDFSIEEELSVTLLKEYKMNSPIKGYHAYIVKWKPELREFFKARLEPEKEKCNVVVGHLSKGKIGRFGKTFNFFAKEAMRTLAKLNVLGKE